MSKEVAEAAEFGPAMTALPPKWRAFVLAYCTNGCDATNAARDAGYKDNGKTGIRVQGYTLIHNPRVLAAVREMTIAMVSSKLPVYAGLIEEIAQNPQSKDADRIKALLALVDRGGLSVAVEKNINVNVTVTQQQKIAEIKQMAETLGLDPSSLLGQVTDAEFEEVPEGLEDVW